MFNKYKLKLEIFLDVCYSFDKWSIFIAKSTVPLFDHFVVKVLGFSSIGCRPFVLKRLFSTLKEYFYAAV